MRHRYGRGRKIGHLVRWEIHELATLESDYMWVLELWLRHITDILQSRTLDVHRRPSCRSTVGESGMREGERWDKKARGANGWFVRS